MHTGILIITILLLLFAALAVFDGFYLHIFRYQLHRHRESRFEHLTHTVRAILFPGILYFLFLKQADPTFFLVGVGLVLLDLVILGTDAFVEAESRRFMGGLPRWEYIIHLFVNGFHFASVAVLLAITVKVSGGTYSMVDISGYGGFSVLAAVINGLLPGSVLLAALHAGLLIPSVAARWDSLRAGVTCCAPVPTV